MASVAGKKERVAKEKNPLGKTSSWSRPGQGVLGLGKIRGKEGGDCKGH